MKNASIHHLTKAAFYPHTFYSFLLPTHLRPTPSLPPHSLPVLRDLLSWSFPSSCPYLLYLLLGVPADLIQKVKVSLMRGKTFSTSLLPAHHLTSTLQNQICVVCPPISSTYLFPTHSLNHWNLNFELGPLMKCFCQSQQLPPRF